MKTRKLLTVVVAILAFAVTNIQAQTLPSYVPTNGLVGYWGFNGNANDQSGNGNDGTISQIVWGTDRFGNTNSTAEFNGIYQRAIRVQSPNVTFGNEFTYSYWLKINTALSYYNTIINANGYCNLYGPYPSYINASLVGELGFSGYLGFNNSSISLNDGYWHHGVMVVNWIEGKVFIYVDGELNATHNFAPQSVSQCNSIDFGQNFNIINDSLQGPQNIFAGELDDISIYNRALTQSEITQLYSATTNTQNLCTKTIQPYIVNVGDATHDGSTYAWSITPAAPNAVIAGNGTNTITIDWTNVPDGSYTLQAIETSITGCVSTAVTATINLSATPAPVAPAQTFCNNATLANLTATGTNLKWYANETSEATLANDIALVTELYYVSQTIGTCESVRTPVSVIIIPQVYPYFREITSSCSGSNLTALPTTSDNGITGTWSPALNNNVTTTYTFTPDAGQCAATTIQTITINIPKVTSPISFVAAPATTLPSVTIGTQVWTNKNLNISTYSDGTPIPHVSDPNQWGSLTTGAWCYYNNDPANGAIYGKLYNWYAVAGIYDAASLNDPTLRKQLAPIGWHVPSEAEWTILTDFLGGENVAGGKMKETGTLHWASPNESANNESGFTGLPGGYRYNWSGPYGLKNTNGFWWSTSEYFSTAKNLNLKYDNGNASNSGFTGWKNFGFSVRLIKD